MSETTASVAENETTSGCQLNGTSGIRVNKLCYAAFPASVVPSRTTWSAGVASWFKANGYCHSIGSDLATIVPVLAASNGTKTFVDYLADVAPTGTFWVGLSRNPWIWVEEYDQGKIMGLSL